jgi:pimeloyl-ACP methyl ester carboxylesterase/acyl carrier protein
MIAPEVLEDLKELFPNAEIFVIYGCSEISCMGCTYPVPRDKVVTKTFVGAPFPNMSFRVVDSNRRLVPVGEAGEIIFSGDGVVKGYLGRPELTEEKFVLHDGRRFYCTGDGGRIHPDGWLEILGRSDFQIQLRGMRIELGEVEFHLRRAPGVRDGVVLARTLENGEKHLVAYVVPSDPDRTSDVNFSNTNIRKYLADQLPDYMVPSRYVALPSLPLNHNLKVDRRALPDLKGDSTRDYSVGAHPTAMGETELVLAQIWSRILGEDVGNIRHRDNFFELGGDSLRAWQLLVQVKQELGVVLSGMEVLREPLEVLAVLCDERRGRSRAVRGHTKAVEGVFRRETFYFGPGDSLYGVFYCPAESVSTQVTVLLVGTAGHEQTRLGVISQNLVRQLTSAGCSVLRFDYFGCGDSSGASHEGSCSRWQADIVSAYDELVARSGGTNVSAIGIRLGGLLLQKVAGFRPFRSLVLWDPVLSGEAYFTQQRALDRAFVGASLPLRWRLGSSSSGDGEDLLGIFLPSKAVEGLRSLELDVRDVDTSVQSEWLVTRGALAASNDESRSILESIRGSGTSVVELPIDCGWGQAAAVEELLPDSGLSKELVQLLMGAS